MNQFLIPSPTIPNPPDLHLEGDEAKHALKVLRLREGDLCLVTDGKGFQARCSVGDVYQSALTLRVDEIMDVQPRSPEITIALGLLKKRDRIEWALEKCTELGAAGLWLVHMDHSERSVVKLERAHAVVESALKQSKGAFMPDLRTFQSLDDVLKPDWLTSFDRVVLADETVTDAGLGGKKTANDAGVASKGVIGHPTTSSPANPSRILVIIGPEGGISARERELLDVLSVDPIPRMETISLGSNRLRAETAAISALLHLQLAPH
ncbi:MAG: RsmE family RNA methyltransferase [Bacteroidetes bacterium]|nr:RsmE family RNA methyltransferase [Bacteroidota bacterium]